MNRTPLLGPAVAVLDPVASRIVIDLGNGYPIVDTAGKPAGLAGFGFPNETVEAIELGVLAAEDQPNDIPSAAQFTLLGTVDLAEAPARAGVYSFPVDDVAAAAQLPLALLVRHPDGSRRVVCRETTGGLYVRADEFVHRLDAHATGVATIRAFERGAPASNVTVHLRRPDGRLPGPVLGAPSSVVTDATGVARVVLAAGDGGNARGSIDGELEQLAYSPRLTERGALDLVGTGLGGSDRIVAHVRAAYAVPTDVDWDRDILPILAPYARVYPIMQEHLADLRDRDAVLGYRAAMIFALTRDIADPNHMPVTRDLSGPKRAALVRWLEANPVPKRRADERRVDRVDDGFVMDAKSAAAEVVAGEAVARAVGPEA